MSLVGSARRNISSTTGKAVRFQFAYNLKSLLLDFVNEKDGKLYEELVCHIRDVGQEIRDDDLMQLLKEARGCASILDDNFRLFVQVVLILKWTHRSEEVISEYQGFLLDLCTAHNYYTKLVLDHLINLFKPDNVSSEWDNCKPSESEQKQMQLVHQVIRAIQSVIPMSQDILISCLLKNYPYLKKPPHEHESYVHNLIQLISYLPSLRYEILTLIITKLIGVDVNIPKTEKSHNIKLEQMEIEDEIFDLEEEEKADSLSNRLDVCMTIILRYIKEFCQDSKECFIMDRAKLLYCDMVKVFENVILPTHAARHVQFLVFYFLSFKAALTASFLSSLWKKVTNPNIAPVIRQSAVFYIASFLTRANFIPVSVVREVLNELNCWIHSYIDCQDTTGIVLNTRMHGVFYATCQAVFYVIAFRYRELVNTHQGLAFLQGLNLGKTITSRLNPLKVCQPAVVSNFAAIARAYQLAYCYTIMERNSRSALPQMHRDVTGAVTSVTQIYLDSYFPFDPYHLKKSRCYIDPLYREYSNCIEESLGDSSQAKVKDEDEDDFLETTIHEGTCSTFCYGTSPGFLQI